MSENKFLKAHCKNTNHYFGLEVKKFGTTWKVVNMIRISNEEAKLLTSEVKQDTFETNQNLIACSGCGNRKVGACSCYKKRIQCSSSMKYAFECIYCREFEIDYSRPSLSDVLKYKGDTVTLSQGKEVKVITFSNVTWEKFDNIKVHPSGAMYNEPKVHVNASEENIEFHGYNVSEMDEGVYYRINGEDDFEIECDVNASTIQPHPGGCFYISFGAINAMITEKGGEFSVDGQGTRKVGAKFHMALAYVNGCYTVIINGTKVAETERREQSKIKVTFGFKHGPHNCHLLSHAYMTGIKMTHGTDK